jgi:hypothetical protein
LKEILHMRKEFQGDYKQKPQKWEHKREPGIAGC